MSEEKDPSCFRIPRNAFVEAVCAADSSRFAIHGVLCDGEKKRLVATDGRTLISVPVPDMPDGQVTAIMPVEALECYRQYAPDGYLKVTADVTIVSHMGTLCSFKNIDGKFPSIEDVLEKPFDEPIDVALAVNARLLKNVADAFGCTTVHVGMKVDSKGEAIGAVLVVPLSDEEDCPDSRAALMTVMVKDKTTLPPRKPAKKR